MDTVFSKSNIILKQLSNDDALMFYHLYHPEAKNAGSRAKTPLEFTRHIIELCNEIYSIRLADHPNEIIGDCALHDWNAAKREIEIGGMLLPGYW